MTSTMSKGFWTCTRVENKLRCGHSNANRYRKCQWCGKPRPPRKQPAHRKALELSMEEYVELNGGPHCGICGKMPKEGERFHRDHEHKGDGLARGVLCFRCNSALPTRVTLGWLRKAVDYLERAEERRG
jgi:hypothetical protein